MYNHSFNTQQNRIRFFSLANKLDGILTKFEANIYIISNPNIHLPRNHPEYLHFWKPLIYKTSITKRDIFYLYKLVIITTIKWIFSIAKEIIRSFRKDSISFFKYNFLDYIFISHNVELNLNEDFYYGNLITELAKKGNKVGRLLISHSKQESILNSANLYDSIVLNSPTKLIDLFKYVIGNIIATLKLFLFCRKNNFSHYEKICIIVGQLRNFYNFAIFSNIDNILAKHKVNKLIMTYEGNAIEKLIFLLCRKYKITSGGYQHAPIIMDQHAIYNLSYINLVPDYIYCSGSYTNEKFIKNSKRKTSILTLGSPKFLQSNSTPSRLHQDSIVLLCPDGNKNSIDYFLKVGQALNNTHRSLKFVLRSHPLLKSYLFERFAELKTSSNNFLISHNDVNFDLREAQWVIYQNSSICIQAIQNCCKVIYLAHPLANIDPLFELDHNHYSAKNTMEISNILDNDAKYDQSSVYLAKVFAQNYFSRMDVDILNKT